MDLGIQELSKDNVLENIDSYSSKMSISKVITFFERKNIYFTKTMIQNYVRVKVLPPLKDQRWYTKKHLICLYIINELKNIFSLDSLKDFLTPLFDKDDDYDFITFLNIFINVYNNTIKEESANILQLESEIEFKNEADNIINLVIASKAAALKNITLDRI